VPEGLNSGRPREGSVKTIEWRSPACYTYVMKRSAIHFVPVVVFAVLGVAAMIFGEADDAPGLVLFGLLLLAGAATFWFKPALLTASRLAGFVVGAIALTAIAALIAGWLEDNF
jgi:hypothetical protein